MAFQLGQTSLDKLAQVHIDLAAVVMDCAAHGALPFTFTVAQGLRTPEMEAQYVDEGKSQTMNSRHLDGHAVDLAVIIGGVAVWDTPHYGTLNNEMQAAAKRLSVPLTWGGSWTTLKDYDHWELPRAEYPSEPPAPPVTTSA